MKVTIGNNPEAPLLEAQIAHNAVSVLMERPGFAELRASFLPAGNNKDIRLSQTDKFESYALLAERIGTRPQIAHEERLRPFVRLLEWGCIGGGYEPTLPVQLQDISSERSLHNEYSVESKVLWPKTDAKQVVEIATSAMQQFAKQLRFGTYTHPHLFDREIGVTYSRATTSQIEAEDVHLLEDSSYVNIYTFASNLPRPRGAFFEHGYYFEMAGSQLRSHKEQLIHLVGVTAIGYADQLASA